MGVRQPYNASPLLMSLLVLATLQAYMADADSHHSSTCSKLYTAKQGDTCASMSSQAKLNISAFRAINPALNCTAVQEGDLVCVSPCRAGHTKKERAQKKARSLVVDYIGGVGTDIKLSEVPAMSEEGGVEQVLVLAFAIDANVSGDVQNGRFSPYWISSITPESVLQIKGMRPNLKVTMSLAGYSQYVPATMETRVIAWYDPVDPTVWLQNAVESVGALVKKYHLDGIDIDYETFPPQSSRTFPKLIGSLIKTLKRQGLITLATIAPYESVLPPYKRLYKRHQRDIDFVNYQFYANNFSTVHEYVKGYHRIARVFPRRKLLASLEVGPQARRPTADVFFEAFHELRQEKPPMPGFFMWAADHSKGQGFLVEKVARCIV